uniref:Uncharacterized protein n=1 Tax=Noctiluca scintillans TaxID=2966 RepID=A0A7S1ADV6_NOCSC
MPIERPCVGRDKMLTIRPLSVVELNSILPDSKLRRASGLVGQPILRRRFVAPKPSLPLHRELAAGWGDLLSEISAASRRLKVAQGGGRMSNAQDVAEDDGEPFTMRGLRGEEVGGAVSSRARHGSRSPRTSWRTRSPEEPVNVSWQSFQVNEAKVPDDVLSALWRRAADPKGEHEPIPPLRRIPRLTVVRRDVEKLPAVNNLKHWRQKKQDRREARKTAAESKRFPTLANMIAPPDAIVETQEPKPPTLSRVGKALARSRAAEHDDDSAERLLTAVVQVNVRCQRRLERKHARFRQTQQLWSRRLQNRVSRLQLDAEEIHEAKMGTIVGSEVVKPKADLAVVGDTVLQYLRRHRQLAELQRRSQQAIYEQQVEEFEMYVSLVADPNRVPERGEVFLCDSFQHILAAGFIVDDTYFFRVLAHLHREDFERAHTVNFIAACCAAFGMDLKAYWAFLKARGLPLYAPRARPDDKKSWEDWAPWQGVELRDHRDVDDLPVVGGPIPFMPILPNATPCTSQQASRDEDPLMSILRQVVLHSVLGCTEQTPRSSPTFSGGEPKGASVAVPSPPASRLPPVQASRRDRFKSGLGCWGK